MAMNAVMQGSYRGSSWRQVAKRGMAAMLPRSWMLVRGPAECRSVCLTFDDGPHEEYTPRLLDLLTELRVKASFFLIGQHIERYPDIVKRIAAEGHLVAHHSYYHRKPSLVSAAELVQEIRDTDRLLEEITGAKSKWFRPPTGALSAGKLCRLWMDGRTVVLWNVDPKDCLYPPADQVSAYFAEKPIQGGDVVLLHDDYPNAPEVLPGAVAEARERGLEFVTPLDWVGRPQSRAASSADGETTQPS